jgi:predicted RNA-binding Zn ribbon-like protein
MADIATETGRFDLDAGTLCLDFANTLDGRLDPVPEEMLGDYDALLTFGLETGSLGEAEAARLSAAARADPRAAADVLGEAIALREAIYPIFSAIATDQAPAGEDLDILNAWVARAIPHGRVEPAEAGFAWLWQDAAAGATAPLDRPLWPIVRDAAELLLHSDLTRLRTCAAHDCGWLFIDTSRNRSRRWCSMQSCGNRATVQQFRERKRG